MIPVSREFLIYSVPDFVDRVRPLLCRSGRLQYVVSNAEKVVNDVGKREFPFGGRHLKNTINFVFMQSGLFHIICSTTNT